MFATETADMGLFQAGSNQNLNQRVFTESLLDVQHQTLQSKVSPPCVADAGHVGKWPLD